MKTFTTDFLIIGGGIIGICLARRLKKIFTDAKITVLEKEKQCGLHASGRNSGVLHAGFYYTPNSLKAKFTRLGNELLTAYCEEKHLAIRQCGKLVIAKNAHDLSGLDELLKRGNANQVVLHELTTAEARQMEPRALTYQRALFSPTTSSINPTQVMAALTQDAQAEGILIHCGTRYLKRVKENVVHTTAGEYQACYIVNAAGLYADKVAMDFGFSKNYRILPFKGIYLYGQEPAFSLGPHIYPVPDLANPFLGVHLTVTVDGKTKIGPTAIPALWREQYRYFDQFHLKEFIDIVVRQAGLLLFSPFNFKKLALEEMKKYSKSHLVKLAASLAINIHQENFNHFGTPGIRAQLINIKDRKLEMDFILEGDHHSMHILNAVSPGFTSAFPFTEHVCANIQKFVSR